jgi:hypothetical protein
MQLGSPLTAVHEALAAALHRDLPEITYQDRDWDAWRAFSKEAQGKAMKTDTVPRVTRTRRPNEDDVECVVFAQTWGSTALGYGGMGGASTTPAYTVVVQGPTHSCVYFGHDRLAYAIDHTTQSTEGHVVWLKDLHGHCMAAVGQASRYR